MHGPLIRISAISGVSGEDRMPTQRIMVFPAERISPSRLNDFVRESSRQKIVLMGRSLFKSSPPYFFSTIVKLIYGTPDIKYLIYGIYIK